jgi:glycerol-3-phosphate dehydrogenase
MTLGPGPSPAMARREAALRRLSSETFDILVVGGGATGAATARDAALRGLKVALVEAGDFAGETSSRSSKLIHGGIRYLQYGDLPLVFEGLAERARLMRIAPHLCRPVDFLFPAFRGERPGLAALGMGVTLYNALALGRPPSGGRRIGAHELYKRVPTLRTAGLVGAHLYRDCQTDDARLVLENVLDAESAGAAIANHLPVVKLVRDRRGRARGAAVLDAESNADFEVRAQIIVIAAGPFTDSLLAGQAPPRLRPTLGVHLVFDAVRVPHDGRVLVLRTPGDNRLFFSMPAGTRTIIGTTDTDWQPAGAPYRPPRVGDEIRARGEDVAYLLAAANHAFPALQLGPSDVVSSYAGLRPLLATGANSPSATSREHDIRRGEDGLISVVGGKLTTLRRMGEQAVDAAVESLRASGFENAIAPCSTGDRPLPGGGAPVAPDKRFPADVAEHLTFAYGSRATRISALVDERPELGSRIAVGLPYLWAEVVLAVRHEHAREVADVFCRRAPLFRDGLDQGLGAAEHAADLIARELGWDAARQARSQAAYRSMVASLGRWRNEAGLR